MSELLNFLLAVAIILIAAKASGYVSVRLGQPSVLGELLVGLLLGPTVLNMLSSVTWFAEDTHLAESLSLFAEIGVLLLMFLAGLELDLKDLLRSGRVAALAGSLGVIIPLAGATSPPCCLAWVPPRQFLSDWLFRPPASASLPRRSWSWACCAAR